VLLDWSAVEMDQRLRLSLEYESRRRNVPNLPRVKRKCQLRPVSPPPRSVFHRPFRKMRLMPS
jgi:hypothetical protein